MICFSFPLKNSYQNLWDAEKAVLKEKFKTLNAYIKGKEISEIKK